MKQPKYSIGSWAFSFGPFEPDPWSFDDFLKFASDAGYDGIEINGFHPHPHPDIFNTDARCKQLKSQIMDLGLGISGYAPDFTEAPPAEVPAEKYLGVLDKCLRFCNRMGIEVLRVDAVSPPRALDRETYDRQFYRLAETWHTAAEYCKNAGVMLVWEFEPGFWLNKPSEVKAIIEAANHSYFKALFDTSHAYMGAVIGARHSGDVELLEGGIIEYAQMLTGLIGHLHLIDSDGTLHDEETSTHSPFGTGYIDFKDFLTQTKEMVSQFDWWCFDFCFCPTTETDAPKAITYINQVINQIP
jgi:sugar phosphate isomerase/epimerase